VSKDKYYIAVINQELHSREWKRLKECLKATESSYCVFYSDVKKIEFNEVAKEVYYELCYQEN
jgi:hypothetical protein